jgi:hypothetical protein
VTDSRIALAALQGAAFCVLMALPSAAALDAGHGSAPVETTAPDVFAARACAALAAEPDGPATTGLLADAALSSDDRLREAALAGDVHGVLINCAFAY